MFCSLRAHSQIWYKILSTGGDSGDQERRAARCFPVSGCCVRLSVWESRRGTVEGFLQRRQLQRFPFSAYLVSAGMPLGLIFLSSWDSRWRGECDGKYRYKTLIAAVTEVADWWTDSSTNRTTLRKGGKEVFCFIFIPLLLTTINSADTETRFSAFILTYPD